MASRGLRMLELSYNKTEGNEEKLPEFRRQNVNVSIEKGSFRFTDVSRVMDVDFFMHEHEHDTLEADEPVFEEKYEPVNDGTTDFFNDGATDDLSCICRRKRI